MDDNQTIQQLQNKIDALKDEQSLLASIDQKLNRFDPNIESILLSPAPANDDSTLIGSQPRRKKSERESYITNILNQQEEEATEQRTNKVDIDVQPPILDVQQL